MKEDRSIQANCFLLIFRLSPGNKINKYIKMLANCHIFANIIEIKNYYENLKMFRIFRGNGLNFITYSYFAVMDFLLNSNKKCSAKFPNKLPNIGHIAHYLFLKAMHNLKGSVVGYIS
jgi:hypothetical protein